VNYTKNTKILKSYTVKNVDDTQEEEEGGGMRVPIIWVLGGPGSGKETIINQHTNQLVE
jgi:adenylylsulfate kinase-like enzyme